MLEGFSLEYLGSTWLLRIRQENFGSNLFGSVAPQDILKMLPN